MELGVIVVWDESRGLGALAWGIASGMRRAYAWFGRDDCDPRVQSLLVGTHPAIPVYTDVTPQPRRIGNSGFTWRAVNVRLRQ